MAAVPMQGEAAVINFLCDAYCQSHYQAEAADAARPMHDGVMPHDRSSAKHVMQPGLAQAADHDGSSPHHSQDQKTASCGVCAYCCIAAIAPPLAAFSVPSHDFSEPVFLAPPALTASFIAAGPDRPPKFLPL